jgi:signal transduction protein with GAF and PtsI domain
MRDWQIATMNHDSVSRERQQLDALRVISQAINAASDLATTLDLITRQTARLMGMDSCSIYLLDPKTETLMLKATTGLDRSAIGQAQLRVGEGLTGWAVEHGQPLAVSDAASDPRFKFLPETGETRFTSLLAVPLVNQSRVIGAINVQTAPFHRYTDDEIELLALIGDLAAGALEKALLYESQRRRLAELSALAEVSRAATSSIYLEDMLTLIVEMAAKTMQAKVCSLLLLDDDGSEIIIRATESLRAGYSRQPPRSPGEGIAGQVMLTRQPLTVADVRTDPRYRFPEVARRDGLVSLLAVPLTVRDRVVGVLRCYTGAPHTFTEQEIHLFSTLANQTALAIENANLTVKAAVVQEMHHRVKNNLQTVAMLLRLQMTEPKAAAARGVLTESINRILSIAAVHDLLSKEGFGLVDVGELLRQVAGEVTRTLAHPGQRVQVEVDGDDLRLPSQPATALALAVNELIQNAVEHGFTGRAEGHIHVRLENQPGAWSVEVSDDGTGLPDSFDPAGTGSLGLEIVRTLVESDLGGTFELTGWPGGTVARIRVARRGEHG